MNPNLNFLNKFWTVVVSLLLLELVGLVMVGIATIIVWLIRVMVSGQP